MFGRCEFPEARILLGGSPRCSLRFDVIEGCESGVEVQSIISSLSENVGHLPSWYATEELRSS